jgi:hypothetical protein
MYQRLNLTVEYNPNRPHFRLIASFLLLKLFFKLLTLLRKLLLSLLLKHFNLLVQLNNSLLMQFILFVHFILILVHAVVEAV